MRFVIVRDAGEGRWQYFWKQDPKITGIIIDNNKIKNHPEMSIKYAKYDDAILAMNELKKVNPNIDYGICPVKEMILHII